MGDVQKDGNNERKYAIAGLACLMDDVPNLVASVKRQVFSQGLLEAASQYRHVADRLLKRLLRKLVFAHAFSPTASFRTTTRALLQDADGPFAGYGPHRRRHRE